MRARHYNHKSRNFNMYAAGHTQVGEVSYLIPVGKVGPVFVYNLGISRYYLGHPVSTPASSLTRSPI
jgi:hypothetical protein